ncbi:MAG TPA: sulfate adenylyltransferase subunit CysN [Burkholderiales bacterium]|nr:sulfate adenylyltransferase subunit CysN [Burkholderiales bacterium]
MGATAKLERDDTPRGDAIADNGVLRFITAGSVDDGKSTLIGRLLHDTQAILEDQLSAVERASSRRGAGGLDLSLLTDGLEAEREQGITIDVAYRYFATPKRKFIIADTPGHEQYTRNMVTGASTANAAVILIDARKGVLPQTRRHTYIAHLLGVQHVIVAVNKMDLIDYSRERFEAIRDEFCRFADALRISDLRFVPVSALSGDLVVERSAGMPWYEGPTLLETLEAIEPRDETEHAPLRFPVQLVVRPGAGTDFRGYAGRIESGVLVRGSEVLVMPVERRTTIRDIFTFEGSRKIAVAGDAVTLLLEGEIDISRGDMIADPAQPPRADKNLVATVCWLAAEPMQPAGRYLLKQTTRSVKARLAAIDYRVDIHTLAQQPAPAALAMNDIAQVRLALQQPVFADPYAANRATGAFILIDEVTNQTVAAGMIE